MSSSSRIPATLRNALALRRPEGSHWGGARYGDLVVGLRGDAIPLLQWVVGNENGLHRFAAAQILEASGRPCAPGPLDEELLSAARLTVTRQKDDGGGSSGIQRGRGVGA